MRTPLLAAFLSLAPLPFLHAAAQPPVCPGSIAQRVGPAFNKLPFADKTRIEGVLAGLAPAVHWREEKGYWEINGAAASKAQLDKALADFCAAEERTAKLDISSAKNRTLSLRTFLGLHPRKLDEAPSLAEPIAKLVAQRKSSFLEKAVKVEGEPALIEAVTYELAVLKARGAEPSRDLTDALNLLPSPKETEAAAAEKAKQYAANKKAGEDGAAKRDEKLDKLRDEVPDVFKPGTFPDPRPNTTPRKPLPPPKLRKPDEKKVPAP